MILYYLALYSAPAGVGCIGSIVPIGFWVVTTVQAAPDQKPIMIMIITTTTTTTTTTTITINIIVICIMIIIIIMIVTGDACVTAPGCRQWIFPSSVFMCWNFDVLLVASSPWSLLSSALRFNSAMRSFLVALPNESWKSTFAVPSTAIERVLERAMCIAVVCRMCYELRRPPNVRCQLARFRDTSSAGFLTWGVLRRAGVAMTWYEELTRLARNILIYFKIT